MVPTGQGGTNGVRHENKKKDLRKALQALSKSEQERQGKNP